jgi:hypothetical protein
MTKWQATHISRYLDGSLCEGQLIFDLEIFWIVDGPLIRKGNAWNQSSNWACTLANLGEWKQQGNFVYLRLKRASGAAGPPVAPFIPFIPAPPVEVIDPSDNVPSAATLNATIEFWAAFVMKYIACGFEAEVFAGPVAPVAPFGWWWWRGRGFAEAVKSRERIVQAENDCLIVKDRNIESKMWVQREWGSKKSKIAQEVLLGDIWSECRWAPLRSAFEKNVYRILIPEKRQQFYHENSK